MAGSEKKSDEYFNVEDLKRYMSLSVEAKLNYLEELNSFLIEAIPMKSKKAWEEFKKRMVKAARYIEHPLYTFSQ